MQVQVWERKPFATAGYNQRFIYSVFTKDTLDEKGLASVLQKGWWNRCGDNDQIAIRDSKLKSISMRKAKADE